MDEDDEEEDVWKTMMHIFQSFKLPSSNDAIRRTIQRWKYAVNTNLDVTLVSRQIQQRYSSEDLFEITTMNYFVQWLETNRMELIFLDHMTTFGKKLEIRYCNWQITSCDIMKKNYFWSFKGLILNITLYPLFISGRWIKGWWIMDLHALFIIGPFNLYNGKCRSLLEAHKNINNVLK